METAENMEKNGQIDDKELENVSGGVLDAIPPYTAVVCSPNGKSVDIHRGPGLFFSNVCRADVGDSVTVLDGPSSGWYKIEVNGMTGYIRSEYLKNH